MATKITFSFVVDDDIAQEAYERVSHDIVRNAGTDVEFHITRVEDD